jgi:hypothetical protein
MAISINVSAAAAIANKDDLKTWIAEEVDRDLSDITDNLDKWILMAEARFNREIRSPEMEKSVTAVVTGEDTPLPADYLAMRAIYIDGSPDRPLRGMAPSAIRQEFDGTTGVPVAYTLVSQALRLVPPPASDSDILITMDYWARIDALSTASPSNWMLEKHPDAYVTAVLFHYYRWSKDRESAVDANAICQGLIDQINRSSRNDRFGAGPLVPNHVVQTRGGAC